MEREIERIIKESKNFSGDKNLSVGRIDKDFFFDVFARVQFESVTNSAFGKWFSDNEKISMWSAEVVKAATVAAALGSGPILEIGAYIGGGTVAFGRGGALSNRRIVTVEKGGKHPGHPVIPSNDILEDLKSNLKRFGISQFVSIVEDNYGTDNAVKRLKSFSESEKFKLICIDSDGNFDRSFNIIALLAAEGSMVLIDDYESVHQRDKAPLTKSTVDRLEQLGFLNRWGIIQDGFWVGTISNVDKFVKSNIFVSRINSPEQDPHCKGYGFSARMPNHFNQYSDSKLGGKCPLLFFEDGILSGPSHYPFDWIAENGSGSYVYWSENLVFSTRDNSDPRTNGRKYEVRLGAEHYELIFT